MRDEQHGRKKGRREEARERDKPTEPGDPEVGQEKVEGPETSQGKPRLEEVGREGRHGMADTLDTAWIRKRRQERPPPPVPTSRKKTGMQQAIRGVSGSAWDKKTGWAAEGAEGLR